MGAANMGTGAADARVGNLDTGNMGNAGEAEVPNAIGQRIAKWLALRNITQAELAERVGVTAAAMNRYVKGVREPRMATLARIAAELSVPIQRLIGDGGNGANIALQDAVDLVARSSGELTQAQRDAIIDALFRKKPQ